MTQHSQHGALLLGRERSRNSIDREAGCDESSDVVSLSKGHTCAYIRSMPDKQDAVKAAVSSFCRSVSDSTDDAVIQYLTGIMTDGCEEGDADMDEIEELVHGFMPGISRLSQQDCHDRLWTLLTQVSFYICKPCFVLILNTGTSPLGCAPGPCHSPSEGNPSGNSGCCCHKLHRTSSFSDHTPISCSAEFTTRPEQGHSWCQWREAAPFRGTSAGPRHAQRTLAC